MGFRRVLFRSIQECCANAQLLSFTAGDSLGVYLGEDPDFTLEVASCMFSVAAAQKSLDGNTSNAEDTGVVSLIQQGVALLDKLISRAPAITQSYILKARAFLTLSRWYDARRCIRRDRKSVV